MEFKKAFFLGGAVLLVAACSNVTAPTAQVQDGSAMSAAKAPAPKTTTTSKPTTTAPTVTSLDDCRTNISISSGRDSTCTDQ